MRPITRKPSEVLVRRYRERRARDGVNLVGLYSINKKKRWEPSSWNTPLIALKSLRYFGLSARNVETGLKVKPPAQYDFDSNSYQEDWTPKKDYIKGQLSMTGSHCLRKTNRIRGEKRSEHKKEKANFSRHAKQEMI